MASAETFLATARGMLKSACWSEWISVEGAAGAVLLIAALIIGLTAAGDYGATIDEFNTNDYGPKALAWYTSGFTDRSQFETVEFSLWYYGPWFQIITAAAGDREFDSVCATRDGSIPSAGHLGPSSFAAVDRAEPQYLAHLDRNDIADLFFNDSAGDSLRRHSPYAVRHSPARGHRSRVTTGLLPGRMAISEAATLI
jgi:hypothetical protein